MKFVSVPLAEVPGSHPLHEALATRPLDAPTAARHAPGAHWVGVRDGVAVARASLWWDDLPAWPDERLGFIGHSAAADLDAGRALLIHAAAELARRGCTLAVGPIDGSTWRSYRLVVDRGDRPPFFLEPQNPDDWPGHFREAGFGEFARYTSAGAAAGHEAPPSIAAAEARLHDAGYRIRPLDPAAIDRELAHLYAVSMASFARNLLFAPIAREEFTGQYAAILPKVDPRLVLLAERGGETAGYVFAIPDLLEAARTGTAETLIVKTLAVHPGHAGAGLGGVLTDRCQRAGAALGFTRVIHALMLDTNVSQRISQRYGQTFRRYALFSRPTA
jgi:GNAT superfamily N-acetyltransferase